MKPEELLNSLRTSADEKLMEEIERSYPADWEAQDTFEKSYHAYRGDQTPVPRRRSVWKIAGALAGFAVVTGAAAAVYLPLQKIDTKPPEGTETVTEATAATTVTSTASTTVSVTETTARTTARQETSTRKTETIPIQTTSLPAAVPTTTALTCPATTAALTTATPVQTETRLTTTYTPETAPPMTAQFTALPRTEAVSTAVTSTLPIRGTNEAYPQTEPFSPTEANIRPVTECTATNPAHNETSTLQYFRMKLLAFGLSTEMTFTGALSPSPESFVFYRCADESFTEQPSPSSDEGTHCYVFEDDGGTVYRVIQSVRDEFSFRYDRGYYPEPVNIAGHAGMLLLPKPGEMPYTALYWDDGSYTFSMTAWNAQPARMLALAESLVPESQTIQTGEEESP